MSERRELTAEERQRLAGYLPFSGEATIEFTPESYLQKDGDTFLVPDGYRPAFTLKPLSKQGYDKAVKIQLDIQKGIPALEKEQAIRDTVRFGLVGWKDLVDLGTMQEIIHEDTENTFKKIPFAVVVELFMQLLRISGLLPGEKLGLN